MRQGMLTHVYIYYRVRPEQDVEIARASVAAMQAAAARRTGVQGRLMQRGRTTRRPGWRSMRTSAIARPSWSCSKRKLSRTGLRT